ncbi:MAG: acyl-CoA dehydrogenase family protein, partial [Burkholderiales bacterium]|nr:acyl-CoA dehydrogenase family protein [Burkholderiales bacterium]
MTTYRSPWANDDVEAFRDAVRRFAGNVLAPREPAWQRERRVDPASWREVGAMGMLLAGVPETYGGGGGTFAHDCVVFEELEYAGVTSLGKHVHEICAHYVLTHGTEDQKRRWLPP